jgi:hypothetical protein
MKLREWLDEWSMTSLKINAHFLEMEWKPSDYDKNAAWELYIELLTRIATQHLEPEHGDEQTALESIYSLFGLTRDVIKRIYQNCHCYSKSSHPTLYSQMAPVISTGDL